MRIYFLSDPDEKIATTNVDEATHLLIIDSLLHEEDEVTIPLDHEEAVQVISLFIHHAIGEIADISVAAHLSSVWLDTYVEKEINDDQD